jgi:hypothetical protein
MFDFKELELVTHSESKLPRLHSHRIFTKLECLKWTYVALELDQNSKNPDQLELNLVLILEAISIRRAWSNRVKRGGSQT